MALTDEGRRFFEMATAGKPGDALVFTRNGAAWGRTHQFRPMNEASAAAKITPAVGFHILRHTHASRLAMKGVPPSYVAATVRAAFGELGIVERSNIVSLSATG